MKALAAAVSCAALAAAFWLGWLSRRPVELRPYWTTTGLLRVSGLAIAIGVLTAAVVWMAARRGVPWTLVDLDRRGGTADGRGRGAPAGPPQRAGDRDRRRMARGAAAVAAAIIATPRFANVPRRPTAVLLAVVGSVGIAAAVWAGGGGLGSTLGALPSTHVPVGARVLLAVHLGLLIVALAWIAARWWWRRDTAIGVTAALREPRRGLRCRSGSSPS